MSQLSLASLQVVANLSACGEVDSEALVRCLRGKSEEEILAVTKVEMNGNECGGMGMIEWGTVRSVCHASPWDSFSLGVPEY